MIVRTSFLLLLTMVGCDSYRSDQESSAAIASDNRRLQEDCMRAKSKAVRTRCAERRERAVWSSKGRGINLNREKQ